MSGTAVIFDALLATEAKLFPFFQVQFEGEVSMARDFACELSEKILEYISIYEKLGYLVLDSISWMIYILEYVIYSLPSTTVVA